MKHTNMNWTSYITSYRTTPFPLNPTPLNQPNWCIRNSAPPKWAIFTYDGKETSYFRNFFRQTDLKIAFHTKNTIGKLLTHKTSLDRQTYIRYLELTNFPALIVIRLTSGKLADDFPQGIKSTDLPFVTITKHTALQNTSMMQRTPSALWMKSCKYYTATDKDPTWIRSNDFTSTRNQ